MRITPGSRALHATRQDQEARQQIDQALAVGIRNARLFRHAGEIALSQGDRAAAENFFRQAAALNTLESEQAQATLTQTSGSAAESIQR